MKLIYIISVLLVLGLVHLIFSMRMEKVKYDLSRENVNKKKIQCSIILNRIFSVLFILAGLFLLINPLGLVDKLITLI